MQKQENNIPPEYLSLPQDSIAPEYPPLPDEYLQREPMGKGEPEQNRRQKQKAMRMVCMLAACVLLGYSACGAEAGQAKMPVHAVEESESSVEGGEDDPAQTAGFSPPEDGTLYYKIYNETLLDQLTADAWERILEEGEIPIEQLIAGEPDYSTPLELHLMAGWEKSEEKGN